MNRPKSPGNPRPGPKASGSRRPRRGPPPKARPPARYPQNPPKKRKKDESVLFADDASTANRLYEKKRNEPPPSSKKAMPKGSATRKKKQAAPINRPRKKPKAFEIRKGEYFDKGESENKEEDLSPLSQISLPRSMIQEDEEKAFRKKFNKDEDDSYVDIYSSERHGAVKVSHSKLPEDEEEKSSKLGKFLIVLIILLAVSAGAIFVFREALRPHFEELGIQLPK